MSPTFYQIFGKNLVRIPSLAFHPGIEHKMKRTGPTNKHLQNLISDLKRESYKQKIGIWKRIAHDLEKSTRSRRIVNISRINRFTRADEVVVVPGKVLGSGALKHNVTVAAFAFSESAREQILNAKGKCLSIPELVRQKPSGKDIRVMG